MVDAKTASEINTIASPVPSPTGDPSTPAQPGFLFRSGALKHAEIHNFRCYLPGTGQTTPISGVNFARGRRRGSSPPWA
jgi:hypothetical protein